MKQQQLTTSTLQQELVRLQNEHGDLPVVLDDADTGWMFVLKASHLTVEKAGNPHGKKLTISVNYSDDQEA